MSYRVFIDGQAGTTGLRIKGRLEERSDIELVEIAEAVRKNLGARLECIAEADVSILCLPDEEAREIASKAGASDRIIDCSTAHRVEEGWTYGLPEVCGRQDAAPTGQRVANPGCHATGYIMAVRPLVEAGIIDGGAQLSCSSLTGYSGGGKAMIAEYEAEGRCRGDALSAPRRYALNQDHKHIPEMQKYSGLEAAPIFAPVVCDFYCGMLVSVGLPQGVLKRGVSVGTIRETLAEYYSGCPLVRVRDAEPRNDMAADGFAGRDDVELFVVGKDDRIEVVARYDNLGKGASGAAVQNLNRMLGLPETAGLVIGEEDYAG